MPLESLTLFGGGHAMQDARTMDPDRVIHAKWMFRAMDDAGLRGVAARRIDLSPEEQEALREVMSERGVAPAVPEDMSQYAGLRGFVRRHWNGDFSLPRSYWLHTFLLPGIVSALVVALFNVLAVGTKARHTSLGALLVIACVVATIVWSIVGTWASAGKHQRRGGSGFWAATARVVLVLGVVGHAAELVKLLPSLREHWDVALGAQPGEPTELVLRADGQSLLVRGGINDDTADAVDRALEQAPGVRTVVLESGGGWVRQGQKLGQVIAARGLATYVEKECSSACTIAFLAGRDRAADPDARLGFHAFRGVGSVGNRSDIQETTVYGAAGLREGFIERVRTTSFQQMWYPSHADLLRERVLTRSSRGGETASLATELRSREAVAKFFAESPVHGTMRTVQPARFDAVVDAAWRALQARRIDREVIAAVGDEVSAAWTALLPGADDATLEAYVGLWLDKAAFISDESPRVCADLVFKSSKLGELRSRLPRSIVTREQEVLLAVMETSSPSRVRRFTSADLDAVRTRVLARMKPQAARVVVTLQENRTSPAVVCSAGIQFLEALLSLPSAERKHAVRALLSPG